LFAPGTSVLKPLAVHGVVSGPGHAGSAPALPFPPDVGLAVLAVGLVVLVLVGYDLYRRRSFGVNS
jgi:hypothetical protein